MGTTGEFIGRRVGRFTITSHLASGGMAELFIARQEAVGGFQKNLVLKMLQERYAGNSRVVEMFLDEARLAAKLNHQNIVHVYDVDEAGGIRYIAMEYIHGETVTDIIRRSIARGTFLPLEHAIHIVAETAAGLAYAHEHCDPEGRPARIVHRDISPSNILVTYEGLTKIVDFGIARVQDQIREESGMRPGKVSYMSPEQVRGESADHRSDIFSLGIILYEITVGRRLWRGPPEVVMRRIVEELIPPPTYVRRDYPPALELIVMKALERRPADRHQSAGDLQRELNEFLEEEGLKSGSRRLSQYMKDLFASEAAATQGDEATEKARLVKDSRRDSGSDLSAPDGDEAEELDFDRRAPLTLRVEARLDDARFPERRPAPVPPLTTETQGARYSSRSSEAEASRIPDAVVGRGAGWHPGGHIPGSPAREAPTIGPSEFPRPAESSHAPGSPSFVGGGHATPGIVAPSVAPPVPVSAVSLESRAGSPEFSATSAVAGIAGGGAWGPTASDAKSETGLGGVGLRWAVLLVLVGAVVVVFLATR